MNFGPGGDSFGSSPPCAIHALQMITATMAVNTIGQPANNGSPIRRRRSRAKPALPNRCSNRRPKNPAITKNAAIRSMWMTKKVIASKLLDD